MLGRWTSRTLPEPPLAGAWLPLWSLAWAWRSSVRILGSTELRSSWLCWSAGSPWSSRRQPTERRLTRKRHGRSPRRWLVARWRDTPRQSLPRFDPSLVLDLDAMGACVAAKDGRPQDRPVSAPAQKCRRNRQPASRDLDRREGVPLDPQPNPDRDARARTHRASCRWRWLRLVSRPAPGCQRAPFGSHRRDDPKGLGHPPGQPERRQLVRRPPDRGALRVGGC